MRIRYAAACMMAAALTVMVPGPAAAASNGDGFYL